MDNHKREQVSKIVSSIFEASIKLNKISDELLSKSPYHISGTALGICVTIMRSDLPLTVPQLAERFFISRQAVQRQVQNLLEDNILQKHENPHHKRSPYYDLTDSGRETIQAILVEVFDPWLNELSIQYDDNLDLEAGLVILEKITNL